MFRVVWLDLNRPMSQCRKTSEGVSLEIAFSTFLKERCRSGSDVKLIEVIQVQKVHESEYEHLISD